MNEQDRKWEDFTAEMDRMFPDRKKRIDALKARGRVPHLPEVEAREKSESDNVT